MDLPPGMTYAEFIRTWTDSQVARWLTDIKCGCHNETFKANDIRGDVILELDQASLKEIGIASIGDRLRILNAVKSLRQRVASRIVTPPSTQSDGSPLQSELTSKSEISTNRSAHRRLEITRPAPLHLSANANRGDLPALIREQPPDSAKSAVHPMIRPLPQPNQSTPPSNGQLSTPNSSVHSITPGLLRPNLPPLPSHRGQPPLPPARNPTRVPAYTTQPPPPTPPQNQGHLTPWVNHYLPSDPRPGNPGSKTPTARSISPAPATSIRTIHGRNGSLTLNNTLSSKLPSRTNANTHPYASTQPTLHPPTSTATHLSPIEEAFSTQPASSPPAHAYTVGRGPFNPTNSAHNTPYSLSDLRRKLVKFVLPDEGLSFTIDVATCNGGIEVLEKVLKKFDKGSLRGDGNLDVSQTDDGGLTVDGWGVFMEMDTGSGTSFSLLITFPPSLTGNFTGQPLSEAELLSICLAPDHPTREHGLTVRRIQKLDDRSNSPSGISTTKKTKRASSISILSGLGVRDPERALDPPSPTSAQLSPAIINAKRPSKLRNFFGQRPPSELITTHLTEYFPNAEKKVLERTARNSMMIRSGTISTKRQSTSSNQPLPSRFSSSTQGSGRPSFSSSRPSSSTLPPPVPEKVNENVEDLPRMSLSTEDGRSVDLLEGGVEKPQLLPPIPFPTESLSESMEGITGGVRQRPVSRATSIASKRMSYMTELRSKRDRSDTASLLTVGEITAEVESRRASTYDREADFDDWTKVDAEIENMVPKAVESDEDDGDDDDEDDEDDEDEGSSVDEEETLNEEELSLDVDDHGRIRNIMSARRGAFVEFEYSRYD